jgi:subtilisin family serine protease
MGLTRATSIVAVAGCIAAGGAHAGVSSGSASAWPRGTAIISYASEPALRAALAEHEAQVVRRLPALRVVEVRPRGDLVRFVDAVQGVRGIVYVEPSVARRSYDEPALAVAAVTGAPQWQFAATRSDQVPASILRAAQAVTIAVVDTGADLTAPDLAAKEPIAYNVRTRSANVTDRNGHGTFVSSLAAGSVSNGEGIAGSGGDARLMVVQAGRADGSFSDVEEAAAIVWAVDHGARVINLSLGGSETSAVERRAVEYAVSKGALLVAAVGNGYLEGNQVEYPAALLQPTGSKGAGGHGLAVAASTRLGGRASFSNTGSHLSLAAPGESVFGAVSSASEAGRFPRIALPGSLAGSYGYGTGTSYAAPQVAGAAALVWAADPTLGAADVATILEQTASGAGRWNAQLGYGVLDVAAAVARATGIAESGLRVQGSRNGSLVSLTWSSLAPAAAFRVVVTQDGGPERELTPATAETAAAYSLAPGSVYGFTVTALDSAGEPLAVSMPWTVSLRPARAALELATVRTRSRSARLVELTALLSVDELATPAGSRRLVLESHTRGRWRRSAISTTDSGGRAVWRLTLRPGLNRVRVRFAGSDDLAAATSRPVALTSG